MPSAESNWYSELAPVGPDDMGTQEASGVQLELSAPRALLLMGVRQTKNALEASTANLRTGPPDDQDRTEIAARLRAARGVQPPVIAGQSPNDDADALAAQIVARASQLVEDLRNGAALSSISDADASAFEAVVQVRGRPALRVEGRLEPIDDELHPGSGFWRPFFTQHETQLVEVASAAGAVVATDKLGNPPWVQGTAWLIAPDLVVTNRHVLFPPAPGVILAARIAGEPTKARIKTNLRVTIDLAHDNGPARDMVYSIEEILYVSAETDFIDIAVFRVKPTPALGSQEPTPLVLADKAPSKGYMYVVGHPGPIKKVPEKVMAVFGSPDERKRVSLGEIMQGGAPKAGTFLHDASTIGGYSGGCVLGFGDPRVVALHYFGHPVAGNRAFTAEALRAHDVANYL